ncbi:hypothetical protein ACWCPQ_17085 [Nocardia sp. NPDC001965]
MSFVVEVSCRDSRWLLRAPAFGVSRFVDNVESIREGAHTMIAQCGSAPKDFDIELEFGSPRDDTDARNLPANSPALSAAPTDPMARSRYRTVSALFRGPTADAATRPVRGQDR